MLIVLLKRYKTKAWLHPGLWFALLWIFVIMSYQTCVFVNFYQEYFPLYVDSLNEKIFFTGISFLIIPFFEQKIITHRDSRIAFNLNKYVRIYGLCSLVAVGGAVGTWIHKGASFNIVSNRFAMIAHNKEVIYGYTSAHQSMLEGVLYKFYLLNLPCALLAGSMLAAALNCSIKRISHKDLFFILLPFVAAFFMTISSGGRRGFVEIFTLYLIGFLLPFTFMTVFNKKRFRIYICSILVFIFSFMIFSTVVKNARTTENVGSKYVKRIFPNELSFLEPISGVIVYLADPYVGYQIKSHYRVKGNLYYGEKTFNGLFAFSIPVIGRIINMNVSVADYLGWEPISKSRWMLEKIPMAVTIESIYYYIVTDYGEQGSLVFIFILAFMSHKIFIHFSFKKRRKNSFLSIYLLVIFVLFWMNSIFSGFFAGPMPGAIFKVFIFYEIFQNITRHLRIDFSFGAFQMLLKRHKQPSRKRAMYYNDFGKDQETTIK